MTGHVPKRDKHRYEEYLSDSATMPILGMLSELTKNGCVGHVSKLSIILQYVPNTLCA